MGDDWPSPTFRQNIVARINEAISKSCPIDQTKNGIAMENSIFSKAKTKDEYLALVTKIIVHVRDMGANKAKVQNAEVSGGNNNIMPDPINALQNLASQGTRNPQMMALGGQNNQIPAGSVIGGNVAASNLLQTLTQQRPGPGQMQAMQVIRGQMNVNVPMNSNMPQGAMGPNSMNNQIGNNMGNINPSMNIQMNQIQNQGGPLGNCLPGQLNQIQSGQIQMNNNLQGQQINTMNNVTQMPINSMNQNQMNIGMNHQQLSQMMGRLNPNQQINLMPNSVNQANIANQGGMANQMNVNPNMNAQAQLNQGGVNPQQQGGIGQSPGQINAAGGVNQIMNIQNMPQKQQNIIVNNNAQMFQANRSVNQNQFLRQSPSPTVASPAGISQSHQNTQMMPSPALVPSSSPQMNNIMPTNQRNVALRQSPNAPLNTPGQVAASSPFNSQEDQIYREKYKQLTKYIEPLRRMVAKVGNEGNSQVEKITKMNKLLELLCNPNQRVPLDTLLKCEIALEKMDIKSYSFGSSNTQYGSNNPLHEAINATLQNPTANHTLQRTFRPYLDAFFGTDIKCTPSSAKQPRYSSDDTSGSEIPHVLQGEIARLDQKFKVSLDSSSQNNNKTIKLICCLDDKRLPCVPPVSVSIPEDYPYSSPSCCLTEQEYSATPFLVAVQDALTARIAKLPKCFSLSHLLDTWEMAVRQACSPSYVTPTRMTTVLGC